MDDYEFGSDWDNFVRSAELTTELTIQSMPVEEAIKCGLVKFCCDPAVFEDIKAHNALLEATRAAPMTEEEVEQIQFFAKHISNCCDGLSFSAPVRTPEPTEEEVREWQEDYRKLKKMDHDAILIKYGVKLLAEHGNVFMAFIDPKGRHSVESLKSLFQADNVIDPLDIEERKKLCAEAERWDYGGFDDFGSCFI